MFDQFDKASLEAVLVSIHSEITRAQEKQHWHAAFRDGAERAELYKKTAEFFQGIAKIVEQTLLERAILETPADVQTDSSNTP